jgi:hypothetical protein
MSVLPDWDDNFSGSRSENKEAVSSFKLQQKQFSFEQNSARTSQHKKPHAEVGNVESEGKAVGHEKLPRSETSFESDSFKYREMFLIFSERANMLRENISRIESYVDNEADFPAKVICFCSLSTIGTLSIIVDCSAFRYYQKRGLKIDFHRLQQ